MEKDIYDIIVCIAEEQTSPVSSSKRLVEQNISDYYKDEICVAMESFP